AIRSTNTATFELGVNNSFQVAASGFPLPTFAQAGALPPGLTFNTSTGVLSGTPARGSGGSYAITISATNSVGPGAMQSFLLNVAAPLLALTPLAPCRIVDTRNVGGPIAAGTSRR